MSAIAPRTVRFISAAAISVAGYAHGWPTSCAIEELDLPHGGRHTYVEATDPSGRWMAGYADPGLNTIVVWHRGNVRELSLPYQIPDAGGINRDGVVVGTGWSGDRSVGIGFAHVDGTVVELGMPGRARAIYITGISRDGLIIGSRVDSSEVPKRAYYWLLDEPEVPHPFRVPRGSTSTGVGVSANGHAAVSVITAEGTPRSFVFDPSGGRTEILGTEPGFGVRVTAIANGWVAGIERNGDTGVQRTARWNLSTGAGEVIPPGLSFPLAVNAHGTLAGHIGADAVLYSDQYLTLPPLIPDTAAEASVVTNGGDAAGYALPGEGSVTAVRWYC